MLNGFLIKAGVGGEAAQKTGGNDKPESGGNERRACAEFNEKSH